MFLVRFNTKEEQEKACGMTGLLFDKKPFIIKSWDANMSYRKSSITTMPIWVKLPKHNVRYWGESTLRKIVGYLGRAHKIDTATLKIERMRYARVLVDMDINEVFPEKLYYTNEHDELVTQPVQYKWLPL